MDNYTVLFLSSNSQRKIWNLILEWSYAMLETEAHISMLLPNSAG